VEPSLELYLLLRADTSNPLEPRVIEAWDAYIEYFASNSYGFVAFVKETEATWTNVFTEKVRKHYDRLKEGK